MSKDDAIEGKMEQEENNPNYHTEGWGQHTGDKLLTEVMYVCKCMDCARKRKERLEKEKDWVEEAVTE